MQRFLPAGRNGVALEAVAQRWMALESRLRQQVRVLIVEDAPEVGELLASCVRQSGFDADLVATAEAGLTAARQRDYDLLIADKRLPGAHDGIDLIGQLRTEGVDTPGVLVTGFPSTETISRAFAQGAVDYLRKPFDDVAHLQTRFEKLVRKRREQLAMQQVVVDLKYIAESGGVDQDVVRELGRELKAARRDLARRPDVMLVDTDPVVAESGARFLKRAGLQVIHPADNMSLPQQVHLRGPMVVFLSLDLAGAIDAVRRIRDADETVGILATGRSAGIDDAIAAVGAGADDYSLGASEGLDVLITRLRRLSQRARRDSLARVLVDLVSRTLKGLGPDVREAFKSLFGSVRTLPDAAAAPAPAPAAEEVVTGEPVEEGFPAASLLPTSPSLGDPNAGPMALAPDAPASAVDERTASLREQVEYGLDALREGDVPVALGDLLRAYRTLAEVTRFFSDPARADDAELVRSFLHEDDALGALLCAQGELRKHLPDSVRDALDGGAFAHPWPPRYLKR